jgi:hypothetical protein
MSRSRTVAYYPGPLTDRFGKIIRFCGGAGSRTRVRKRSAQATTCVSGDLVFVSEVAHRRGVSELIPLVVAATPEGVAWPPSPLNGR